MSEELRRLAEEELLAEDARRPWHERHHFIPPTHRDGLTLGLILAYERCYEASGNPVFVFMAHQARTLLRLSLTAEECALRFGWIDEYFNCVAGRMTKLVEAPPRGRDAAIAEALGFERAKPGPASSEFSDAKRSMRDIRIGVAVELLLPTNNRKMKETCKQVGAILSESDADSGNSESTVAKAYRWYKNLVRRH
jgi:hypothetical protein